VVTVAVIPARGGSQRIRHKNIVDFGARPLIDWTIDAALESGRFDAVIVSTDDPEIEAIANRRSVIIHKRVNHADSMAPVSMATIDALSSVPSELGPPGTVVQLMPSCPLRTAADISQSLDDFHRSGAPSQISCADFGHQSVWWTNIVDEHGQWTPLFPDSLKMRSQDLPQAYCPSGAVWIARREALVQEGTFYCSGHTMRELSWESAFDIDTPEDLEIARKLKASS